MKPSQQRDLASIRAELARLARYDDESIVHDRWALCRRRHKFHYADLGIMPIRDAEPLVAAA